MIEPYPVYEIRLQGHLDKRYRRWFEGLDWELLPDGDTRLTGALDAPALHGILNRIRDLNLPLLLVRQLPQHDES